MLINYIIKVIYLFLYDINKHLNYFISRVYMYIAIWTYSLLMYHYVELSVTEHCEAETFRAQCGSGEAVLMTQAKYGRMKVGRCVLRNYGYVGCSSDVLPHMDNLCSGRQECRVRIPDASLDQANPCPGDFKTYLEATYQCVKGRLLTIITRYTYRIS